MEGVGRGRGGGGRCGKRKRGWWKVREEGVVVEGEGRGGGSGR